MDFLIDVKQSVVVLIHPTVNLYVRQYAHQSALSSCERLRVL